MPDNSFPSDEMNVLGSYSPSLVSGFRENAFDSLANTLMQPSYEGLSAEFNFDMNPLTYDEAVTLDWSLYSPFSDTSSSFDATSPTDSINLEACMVEDSWENNHDLFLFSRAEPIHIPLAFGFRNRTPTAPVSPRPGQSVGQRLRCSYNGCTSAPFQAMCELKLHLKDHSAEVLSQWHDGQQCGWPMCPSKARFKSPKMLQTHLDNIHVHPLRCSVKGCTQRTPFRSNYDLKRHIRTAHTGQQEPQFHCPYPNCMKDRRVFVRKDKWLNHLRSSHLGEDCPLNHCEAGKKEGLTSLEIVEHIKKFHGNYECSIGSCGSSSSGRSRFVEFELLKHLELSHGMQHRDIGVARNAAKLASDRTVRPKDVPECGDCHCCEKKVEVLKVPAGDGIVEADVAGTSNIRFV